MPRIATLLLALLIALPATAQAPRDQLLSNVSRELPLYVPGTDASTLSRSQLATIYSIMHGGHSDGEKRVLIRSVLGGQYSLRGLLFKRN